MQEQFKGFTIQYQEYNNTWTCNIEEVTIKAESLRECREKIEKFLNKKTKQNPVECYVSKYGNGVQKARITSINQDKVYYTTDGVGSSRTRNQDNARYMFDFKCFKLDNEANQKRFEEIEKIKAQIKEGEEKIKQITSEFDVMAKMPYGEEE